MQINVPPKLLLVGVLILVSLVGIGARTFVHRDTVVPVVITMEPASPTPNQLVTLTVQLSSEPAYDQHVTIGCTDPAGWVDLPSDVVVPAGYSSCTFTAHTSGAYTKWAVVTGTCNGGSAIVFG
jgi:hypothetical protein